MALPSLPMWVPVFLLLLTLLLIKKLQVKRPSKHLPPSPPKLPIIGHLHLLGHLLHRNLWDLSKRYGPVMFLKVGSLDVIVVSSADTAKEILKVHDLDCCSRPRLAGSRRLTYNFLDVAFSPYTDYWREVRKLTVLEVFSIKRVQSFRFLREDEIQLLLNFVSQAASSSTPVNLTERMFSYSASILFRMVFGKTFQGSGYDDSEFHKLVHDIATVVGEFSAEDLFPYVGWIVDRLTGHHAKAERVFRQLDSLFQDAITRHLDPKRVKQDQGDIIDVMLQSQRDQRLSEEACPTSDNIKGVLMNMFFGGIDTSALTVVWTMAELARNPRVMKKAQDEVRACIGRKERITEDDIHELQYLKLVIKESLRLHPIAPLLVLREAMSSFKLSGYDVAPKDVIIVNAWGIAQDPKYWDKPEEFFPERFMDNPIDFKGQNFEFLPFGSGRRICPGMHMGLTAVEIALANLLYFFIPLVDLVALALLLLTQSKQLMIYWARGAGLNWLELRWRSRRQSLKNRIHHHPHPGDTVILDLHLIVDMETLMVDLVVALVVAAALVVVDLVVVMLVAVIGQAVPMGVEQVVMGDIVEGNLVGMEDMAVQWELIEENPPLGMPVVMEVALTGVMTWELVMVAPARFMVDMAAVAVVLVVLAVAMEVAMTQAWVVAMEVAVEVPSLEVEEDMEVLGVADTILMGGRSF